MQTRRCSKREGLGQLGCPPQGVPRARASRRMGRWKAAVGIGVPEAAGPPLGMRRGSEPVGVSAKRAPWLSSADSHADGGGQVKAAPPTRRRAAARPCGEQLPGPAGGPLLRLHNRFHGAQLCCHNSPGWPSAGQRCRLEASSGFPRRPQSQHIFEGLPRPTLWTRPLSSPRGSQGPGERGIEEGLGGLPESAVSSPQGRDPTRHPHHGPAGHSRAPNSKLAL